jgi:hypothetical protein
VDPVPDPLLLRKSGSAGNRTLTFGSEPGPRRDLCGVITQRSLLILVPLKINGHYMYRLL